MKRFLIIRHAESLANAGEKTDTHDTIPLTEKGKKQALELAEKLDVTPDLIVISPYTRTHETAAPFIAKHPGVPVEIWDVHEFTYLDPAFFNGTTPEERKEAIMEYWEHKDINSQASLEAESFSALIRRIEKFVEQLRTRQEQTIVVFAHSRFIHTLKLYIRESKKHMTPILSEDIVRALKKEQFESLRDKTSPLPENASVYEIPI